MYKLTRNIFNWFIEVDVLYGFLYKRLLYEIDNSIFNFYIPQYSHEELHVMLRFKHLPNRVYIW